MSLVILATILMKCDFKSCQPVDRMDSRMTAEHCTSQNLKPENDADVYYYHHTQYILGFMGLSFLFPFVVASTNFKVPSKPLEIADKILQGSFLGVHRRIVLRHFMAEGIIFVLDGVWIALLMCPSP